MLTWAAPGGSTYFMLVVDGHGEGYARGWRRVGRAGASVKDGSPGDAPRSTSSWARQRICGATTALSMSCYAQRVY